MIGVRAIASTMPSRIVGCGACGLATGWPPWGGRASTIRHLRLVMTLHRRVVGFLSRGIGQVRLDIRISGVLLLCRIEAFIGDRVGVARAQTCNGVETRRIDWIGRDVVDSRQPPSLDAEISRISNQREADEQRGNRLLGAGDTLKPDDDECAQRKQYRDRRQHQGAGKGRQRRHDFERPRAHDDDGNHGRGEREKCNTSGPDGEPRNRFVNELMPRHRCLFPPRLCHDPARSMDRFGPLL